MILVGFASAHLRVKLSADLLEQFAEARGVVWRHSGHATVARIHGHGRGLGGFWVDVTMRVVNSWWREVGGGEISPATTTGVRPRVRLAGEARGRR